ncbi:SMP-30/gluconolactonase/LRE family protein [Fodinicola feengrottensis]|uniref:SMP-30/gluconolactonase/LRE family protein n=1 Tax=Fodinicola feengrottensis TaxID=435914 RepID=A0ABP4VIC8_9ACTN
MSEAVQVTDPISAHGEGPVWHPGWGGLRWVDMLVGDVLWLAADGSVRRRNFGPVAAVLRPRVDGGAVLAVERGFSLLAAGDDGFGGGTEPKFLGEIWTSDLVRMNEGGCDPDGRFYCGSMPYDEKSPIGKVYRLDPDGSVTVVLAGVTISNGFAFSPDGGTAYYVDTPTHRIDAFDYSASGLTNRRTTVSVPVEAGGPDGLTVDSEGYIWLALFGGSAVHRYAPDGRLDGVIELPTSQITACTFGGPDLDQLYITTSQLALEPGSQPLAGALFVADVGVRGLPVQPFAG